jgi:hypothetical protein
VKHLVIELVDSADKLVSKGNQKNERGKPGEQCVRHLDTVP